jgi:hypothetical protein
MDQYGSVSNQENGLAIVRGLVEAQKKERPPLGRALRTRTRRGRNGTRSSCYSVWQGLRRRSISMVSRDIPTHLA